MDVVNFDALKAQGRILDLADVDPNEDYLIIGKYTNKYTTDNFKYTKYPIYAIKAGDVLGVQSVTGLNTDNTDPYNPIVKISVDGVTITGEGTPASPLVAVDPRPYKVYTALLTQSGGDNLNNSDNFPLEIGVTYTIIQFGTYILGDFTNVGAPNNNIGTSFVATGTTPNSWGTNIALEWNAGAPIATVLENTIGNIWFTYNGIGDYGINSNELFIENKTFQFINNSLFIDEGLLSISNAGNTNSLIYLSSNDSTQQRIDGYFDKTPIEIRVYN